MFITTLCASRTQKQAECLLTRARQYAPVPPLHGKTHTQTEGARASAGRMHRHRAKSEKQIAKSRARSCAFCTCRLAVYPTHRLGWYLPTAGQACAGAEPRPRAVLRTTSTSCPPWTVPGHLLHPGPESSTGSPAGPPDLEEGNQLLSLQRTDATAAQATSTLTRGGG